MLITMATFRVVMLDEHMFGVYQHHSAKWKTARDDLETTSWWRLFERCRLRGEYRYHLQAAVDAQHHAFRIEQAS